MRLAAVDVSALGRPSDHRPSLALSRDRTDSADMQRRFGKWSVAAVVALMAVVMTPSMA
ncbi:hypothetical protein [Catellatospora vulcania]|uniref:hypothetical protein n=1 Tax=Catellatospora vulcania TaxID=1460450 RepID=UPI0012D38D6F|nr:hypothetical protein [Catellatospora vulcania]